MSDVQHEPKTGDRASSGNLFSPLPVEPPRRNLMLVAAGLAVLLVLSGAVLLLHGHHEGRISALNAELPPDPYGSSLSFTQVGMSQSTSLSGGVSTFIDGRVRNTGSKTVTGVTLQVLFRNDEGLAPQVETLALSLIRTHEPYVDTEPVNAAPLKPGDEAEFRLIFESIPANWNQQLPTLRAIRVVAR